MLPVCGVSLDHRDCNLTQALLQEVDQWIERFKLLGVWQELCKRKRQANACAVVLVFLFVGTWIYCTCDRL